MLKKPVFEKGNADDWLSKWPSAIQKYNDTIQNPKKLTPIQASKKFNEKIVYNNLKHNTENQKPNFKLGHLVRTADIENVFSKSDGTHYSYKLYTITEIIHDTIHSYRINFSAERYKENLLLPTKLSLDENNQFEKELNRIQKNKTLKMELTEDQKIGKYAKQCGHCKRNTLLVYEHEFTCISCGYDVVKKARTI